MANPTLTATPRAERGKNASRRIRTTGRVPVILYGTGQEPVALTIDSHEFQMLLRREGEAGVIDLQGGDDANTPCVIREIQREPITSSYLHVDLLRIDLTKIGHFSVEVIGVGQPEGVTEGGILETHARSIEVACLPADLPHSIEIDITGLGFHKPLLASELALPENVTLHSVPSMVLFSVVIPKVVEEEVVEEAVEGEEGEEPELVEDKKEEGAENEEA